MFALEVSKDKGLRKIDAATKKKPGFVITGAQHAREASSQHTSLSAFTDTAQWIATSTAMFVAHALLANSSESYSLSSLLNTYVSPSCTSILSSYLTDIFFVGFLLCTTP